NVVGLWTGRSVGRLGDDARPHVPRVGFGKHAFERGWNQDVAVQLEQVLVTHGPRARRADYRAGLLFVSGDQRQVQAVAVEHAAARVAHGDHFRARLGDEARRGFARVAIALDHDARTVQVEVNRFRGLLDGIDHAPTGRFLAPFAAA